MANEQGAASRRAILRKGVALAGGFAVPGAVWARMAAQQPVATGPTPIVAAPPAPVPARPLTSSRAVRPELLRRALAAMDRHGGRVARDRIAIADFTAPSAQARLHLIDLVGGASQSLLVAHGSGSDPAHTGYLQRFSNDPGSNASSEGAFATGDYYVGKHGRSQRLIGLDPTNDNALSRAIVVHAAWYAEPELIRTRGMLGRSQGCFAVGERDLERVFAALGPGRMIFAAKA